MHSHTDWPAQKKYLAQVYNIGTDYAQGLYDFLPKKDFAFSEVEALAEHSHLWYKEEKFRPSNGEKLVGQVPSMSIYN
jgi:catalase